MPTGQKFLPSMQAVNPNRRLRLSPAFRGIKTIPKPDLQLLSEAGHQQFPWHNGRSLYLPFPPRTPQLVSWATSSVALWSQDVVQAARSKIFQATVSDPTETRLAFLATAQLGGKFY